ncbi:MAG: HAD family phosphatase [Spirochaetales bacterium]|nr:HAD family phosphatase [Spirochaetales bacterium]
MTNRIKLICLDIDNTLVDVSKNIPENNLKAIRWAYEKKGIHIAVNSSRIGASVRDYMERLGVHEAYPALGGVILQDWDGSIIEEHTVDTQAARAINAVARDLGCTNFIYHHDFWCVDPGNDYWAASEYSATKVPGGFCDTDAFILSDGANKMLGVNSDPEIVSELQAIVQRDFGSYVDCFKSDPKFLEIVPKGINKGTAVLSLCNFYGIERENVMSMGDFYNDLDMFCQSGISVAMANAPEDIKKAVTFVTEADADHSGVAEAIYHFLGN